MSLSPGKAHFEVIKVYRKDKEGNQLTTMAGIPKVRLQLRMTDDMLLEETFWQDISKNMGWMLENMANALKVSPRDGQIQVDDLVGKRGECILEMQEAKNGYPERLIIKKFMSSRKKEWQGYTPGTCHPAEGPYGPGSPHDQKYNELQQRLDASKNNPKHLDDDLDELPF